MKKLLFGLLIPILLTGCDLLDFPEWKTTVISIHIKKGGSGTTRMAFLDITSTKEGEDGKEQLSSFAELFQIEKYDTEFEKHHPSKADFAYDEDGRLNAFLEFEHSDIFSIAEFMGIGDDPSKNAPSTIQWDGDILFIEQHFKTDITMQDSADMEIEDEEKMQLKIVITTEGELVSSTLGEISQDRKKLVIFQEDEGYPTSPFCFKIKGLAKR